MSNQRKRRIDQMRRRAQAKERRAHRIEHKTIATGGRPVPGLPFMGEMMTCELCGKTQQSDPKVESNWRVIELDGVRHYVCSDHFPPADSSAEAFRQAYIANVKALMQKQAQ